jgi:hypothetical protein
LEHGDEKEKLRERNDAITIGIGHLQHFRGVLELLEVGLVVLDLCVVVGCECAEEICVAHHKFPLAVLRVSERFKDLLGWGEKADLILICPADSILPRGLFAIGRLVSSEKWNSQKEKHGGVEIASALVLVLVMV